MVLIDQDNEDAQETPHRMRQGSRCTEKCGVMDTLSYFAPGAKPSLKPGLQVTVGLCSGHPYLARGSRPF